MTQAANIARNLILVIDFHDNLGRILHQSILTTWTLAIVSLTAVSTEQLSALIVLTFQRLIDYFLTNATQEILVKLFNRWTVQSNNIKALHL